MRVEKIIIGEDNQKYTILADSGKNSIDILFEWRLESNIKDLFFILKYYSSRKEFLVYNFYTIALDEDSVESNIKPSFFRKISYNRMNSINIIDFEEFFYNMFEYDKEKYLNPFKYYGIRILFWKESPVWDKTLIFPEYPWKVKFLNAFYDEKHKNIEIVKKKHELEIEFLKKKYENIINRILKKKK